MESTFNSVADWPIMCKRILDKISQEMIPLLQERRAAPFLAEKFKRDVIKKLVSKGRFDHLKIIGLNVSEVFADYGLDESIHPSLGKGMPKTGDIRNSKNMKSKPRATRIISNAELRFRDIRPSEQQQEYERQMRHKFIQVDGGFDIKEEDEDDFGLDDDDDYDDYDDNLDDDNDEDEEEEEGQICSKTKKSFQEQQVKEELSDDEIVRVSKKLKRDRKATVTNGNVSVKEEFPDAEIMSDSDSEESDDEGTVFSLLTQDKDELEEKPMITPLSSDEEEEEGVDLSGIDHDLIRNCQNLVLCQYDKIRRHKGRFKMYLTHGTMILKGRDFVFRKANGEASMYEEC